MLTSKTTVKQCRAMFFDSQPPNFIYFYDSYLIVKRQTGTNPR